MFKKLLLVLSFALSLGHAAAQGDAEGAAKPAFVKTGFSFGILPSVAYDADLGFAYGAISNLYWYGDGSLFPRYRHSLYLEGTHYAAGNMLCRVYYDSPVVLGGLGPNLRLTADLTWFRDLTCDFNGFNGRKSVYNADWADEDSEDYRTRVFYSHHRNMSRAMLTVRQNVPDSHIFWQAGFTIFKMGIADVHRSELRHSVPDAPTLYGLYRDWGVIRPSEAKGGTDGLLRLSVGVDTRDKEACPSRGVWSEAVFALCPNMFSTHDFGFARMTLYHRQYFSLGSPDLVFAYRAIWQHKLGGRIPFYLLPHISTATLTSATNQGLGGAKTMRGVVRNRIVADGTALANLELRWIFARVKLAGQEWGFGTNFFSDLGITTQEYDVEMSGVPDEARSVMFRSGNDKLHSSLGLGFKLHMNTNFIVSVDYGHALNSDDGKSGFYVMLNYLF